MAGRTPDRPVYRCRDTGRRARPRSQRRRARAIAPLRGPLDRGDDPIDLARQVGSVCELKESLSWWFERLPAHALIDGLVRLGVVPVRATGPPGQYARACAAVAAPDRRGSFVTSRTRAP